MKVKCINPNIVCPNGDFTLNKVYDVAIDIQELDDMYCVIDDTNDRNYVRQSSFEVVDQ